MKIIEANEGPKIHYEESGTWINFDDQIMLNLKKSEADHDVHIDITSDAFGRLNTGAGDETEVPNPDYVEPTEDDDTGAGYVNKTITKREPLPFSMENVTVTLFALKEGVF
mgnify:CR=1 FL=1